MSSNPAHGEVYSIQHYVIKFVSDLRQVGGFKIYPGTPVSSTYKTDRHDITEILLKVALNIITPNPLFIYLSIMDEVPDTTNKSMMCYSLWIIRYTVSSSHL